MWVALIIFAAITSSLSFKWFTEAVKKGEAGWSITFLFLGGMTFLFIIVTVWRILSE